MIIIFFFFFAINRNSQIISNQSIVKIGTKTLDQLDGQLKSTQRLADDLLKENFRSSMTDDSKNVKISKTNTDCDKVKVNKSESFDSNGKRIDSSGLSEPLKKKQKRPRDEKSSDIGSTLPSSVSITPIASMQSSASTALSNTSACNKLYVQII